MNARQRIQAAIPPRVTPTLAVRAKEADPANAILRNEWDE